MFIAPLPTRYQRPRDSPVFFWTRWQALDQRKPKHQLNKPRPNKTNQTNPNSIRPHPFRIRPHHFCLPGGGCFSFSTTGGTGQLWWPRRASMHQRSQLVPGDGAALPFRLVCWRGKKRPPISGSMWYVVATCFGDQNNHPYDVVVYVKRLRWGVHKCA